MWRQNDILKNKEDKSDTRGGENVLCDDTFQRLECHVLSLLPRTLDHAMLLAIQYPTITGDLMRTPLALVNRFMQEIANYSVC